MHYEVRYEGAAGQAGKSGGWPSLWLAILEAQRIAAEWQIDTYIWDDGTNCATVHPDGRMVVTI
jgi:hypothetical protein